MKHQFEHNCAGGEIRQHRVIETTVLHCFHHGRQPSGQARNRVGVIRIVERQGQDDAAFGNTVQVADLHVEQLVVRHDDLLAVERTDSRRLEADRFDAPGRVAKLDRFAHPEWPVEQDRKCCKQIAKDALSRKADRNAANA